jgi:outer membrane protein OmpA-like peptidoglycan-associated protein
MNHTLFRLIVTLLITCWALSVNAVRYGAPMNHAEWRLELSPFECRMWQPVPYFGDAVFSHRAGEEQKFYLAPTRKAMKAGAATLVSEAPVWDESRRPLDMGTVAIGHSVPSISVGKRRSYQLLNELYDGMAPTFSRPSWYAEDEQIELSISSVNFRKAYGQYQECLAGLLPVNFDQINRTRIHFNHDKYELNAKTRGRLDQIVMYVKADTSVTGFYIDGHTDATGRRLYNLELSKKRAESVTKYLVSNGVDEAMITTRYHGERYAVTNNRTVSNRAANRRVTLRLEREGF